ncbi:MAG: hypothetical protein NZ777_16995 [Pseudomonadales bacterium]|nr:hypothetical protein [Pseudomonadales bacterium]
MDRFKRDILRGAKLIAWCIAGIYIPQVIFIPFDHYGWSYGVFVAMFFVSVVGPVAIVTGLIGVACILMAVGILIVSKIRNT